MGVLGLGYCGGGAAAAAWAAASLCGQALVGVGLGTAWREGAGDDGADRRDRAVPLPLAVIKEQKQRRDASAAGGHAAAGAAAGRLSLRADGAVVISMKPTGLGALASHSTHWPAALPQAFGYNPP